jgi:predicted lysophospholipase L1 biosynthesis ABC-type transport system permease subunit
MMTYCIYGLGFIVIVAGIIVLAAVILAGRNDRAHGRK